MNKEQGQHARKSSLFSLSYREKPTESQVQSPSYKPKASSSLSRDITINSAQKIPEEISPRKLPQDLTNTPRLQSSSAKNQNLKQHKRSISDAHLKINPDKTKLDRDLKSATSPRLVKERASTLKRLVEPSIVCNQGPTDSSMSVMQSRKSSQNQISAEMTNDGLVKRSSKPEAAGKNQDADPIRPLRGIVFQDIRKRSFNEKASETPKSKPTTQTNTPKNSFSSLLAKHKHGSEYSPKISARTLAKDVSPRKRASIGPNKDHEAGARKGIKAHDKGLSIGQMYIFTTEAEEKDKKEKDNREEKDTPVQGLQAAFPRNKSIEKKKTKNTEEERPKPVMAKNMYEKTLERDLANYKIMLDSNKQTFDFERMMIERRKNRQRQGNDLFTEPAVKTEGIAHRKSLDMGAIIKNRILGEACLSAKAVNPSTLDQFYANHRPVTCNTPRVGSEDKDRERTGSSRENADFERFEKMIEAEEEEEELRVVPVREQDESKAN